MILFPYQYENQLFVIGARYSVIDSSFLPAQSKKDFVFLRTEDSMFSQPPEALLRDVA